MLQEDAAARAPAVPIVYGSVAFWLGRKTNAGEHTHKWSVYVRHAHDKDLSYVVERVEITLHPSFANPVRVFTAPPYVVSETGWGEFEVGFKVTLRDRGAAPLVLAHKLALYPPNQVYTERPVLTERYDEIVFNALPADPAVRAALLAGPTRNAPAYPYHEVLPTYAHDDDVARIAAARAKLAELRAQLAERLLKARAEAEREKDELRALGAI